MLSIWWVLAAFIAGGCAGILLLSLMTMAGREARHSESDEQADTRRCIPSASAGNAVSVDESRSATPA